MQAVASLLPDTLIPDVFPSAESFFERLRQPTPPTTSVLLMAGDASELSHLLSMNDFLRNLRIIVAVPDESPETLGLARRFWPRYIASGEGDFSDVAAVLGKMAKGQKAADRQRKGTCRTQ